MLAAFRPAAIGDGRGASNRIGIVELGRPDPRVADHMGSQVAWRLRAAQLHPKLEETPVDAVVLQIDLDDRRELISALKELTSTAQDVKVYVAGTAGELIFAAEITGMSLLPREQREAWLTKRECQVLDGIVAGRTNAEIAYDLRVSLSTVNKHVESILRKLSARNRVQAVARYLTGRGGSGVVTREITDG
jgi:DNA-binding NarL/FixJ family response regulator